MIRCYKVPKIIRSVNSTSADSSNDNSNSDKEVILSGSGRNINIQGQNSMLNNMETIETRGFTHVIEEQKMIEQDRKELIESVQKITNCMCNQRIRCCISFMCCVFACCYC